MNHILKKIVLNKIESSETFGIIISLIYYITHFNNIRNKGGNNKISYSGAFINKSSFSFFGNNNKVLISKKAYLENLKVVFYGDNHKLIIDKKCIIKSSEFWFEDYNGIILIGTHTRINGAHIAVTEPNSSISIGEDCLFSKEIDIRNGDSHSIIDLITSKRINYAEDIVIGNHVWLGKSVKILKGTNIGNNVVIGIGSIVTQDIKSNSLAVGSPARIVKENITWEIQRIYD